MAATQLTEVYQQLRDIMLPCVNGLDVKTDSPGHLDVDTHYIRSNKQALWFGGVRVKKRYVSYHLMPVYVNPSLLEGMSDALKKRMQGKSCFNFSKPDVVLFDELKGLTERAVADYRNSGYLEH